MNAILEAAKVNKVFTVNKIKTHVLKDVSLTIGRGEYVAVMGPSGSGKSTLLYTLSGMDNITGGSVVFSGRSLETMKEKELSRLRLHTMGFIFQHNHLLKNLSIRDNILVSAYLAKKRSRKDVENRAGELMERTGIAGLAANDITQASGGQLQRASICRALINDPEILFGDEPTGALDSVSSQGIMEILDSVNRSGTTVLLVTHDVRVAARAGRVLFMQDGRIAGEHKLGKNADSETVKDHEREISQWLVRMGA